MHPTCVAVKRNGRGNMRANWGVSRFIGAGILSGLVLAQLGRAAVPQPETFEEADRYVHAASVRLVTALHDSAPGEPVQGESLRSGKILVAPARQDPCFHVAHGLVHDWVGTVFLPGVSAQQVIDLLRDYEQCKRIYQPHVMASRTVSRSSEEDHFFIVLQNESVLKKFALEGHYVSTTVPVESHGGRRWMIVSRSDRLQEVLDYGEPSERRPPNSASSYIWRLYSFTTLEQGDGGVYMQVEAIALSRDIPAIFQWFVGPLVNRISRNAMTTTLKQTRAALAAGSPLAHR